MTSSFVLLLMVAVAGCSTQSRRPGFESQNSELRRMLMETRRDLEEVRRDQDRLRDQIEYLQHTRGSGAGDGDDADSLAVSGWPQDLWGANESYGSASDYDSLGGADQRSAGAATQGSPPPAVAGVYNDPQNPGRVPQPREPAAGESRIVMGVRNSGAWTEPGQIGVDTPAPNVPSKLRGTGYDDGVRAFSDEHYEDAIQYFRDFIHENPQSEYADDAQFWIGECYLRKQLYSNAIKEFNQVVLRYATADRSAAALLKLAEVFSRIGDQVDARLSLQKLVNRYPGSSEAADAYRLLKEMGS